MSPSPHRDFKPKASPETCAPPDEDRWSPESDAMAEALDQQQRRLLRARRIDHIAGLVVTLLAVMMTIAVAASTAVTFASIIVGLLIALLYMPLRSGPRQRALAEIEARLEIVDPSCPSCGYTLRHLTRMRCPECGRRVQLPSQQEVQDVAAGGPVAVARGSVASDLGWIVLLIMMLTTVVIGKFFGLGIGLGTAGLAPLGFLLVLTVQRRRRARSIPPYAVCDACGQSTLLLRNQCSHCAAPLLTDHVYVRPGLRGDFDPRLQRTWAQFVGGARVCAMLPLFSLWAPELGGYERQAVPLICLQLPLGTVGLVLLSIDRRLRSKSRLEKLDKAIRPLCHHCLRSLHGKPATGVCPHCKRAYRAIELAGGC